ncbi:hypothetical protein HDV03_000531, partial [Kappamyces sp. JEL0829]
MTIQKLSSSADYILKVSAGPDYDHLVVLDVNGEETPLKVNSPHFTGFLLLRMVDFAGLTPQVVEERSSQYCPKAMPDSGYFKGRNRRYSMTIQGRFKQEWSGDDIIFGVDSPAPIPSVPGSSIAIRVGKWIDPALEADISGPNPHILSPIVSGMNSLAVFPADDKGLDLTLGHSFVPDEEVVLDDCPSLPVASELKDGDSGVWTTPSVSVGGDPPLDIQDWAYGMANVPEHTSLLFTNPDDAKYATSYERRKKLFGNRNKRLATRISPEYLYGMDFYDAYFDFSSLCLKLPGVSISIF